MGRNHLLSYDVNVGVETDGPVSRHSVSNLPTSLLSLGSHGHSLHPVGWKTTLVISVMFLLWLSISYNCKAGKWPFSRSVLKAGSARRHLSGGDYDRTGSNGTGRHCTSEEDAVIADICALMLEMEEESSIKAAEQRLVRELNQMISAIEGRTAAVAGASVSIAGSSSGDHQKWTGPLPSPVSSGSISVPSDLGNQYFSLLVLQHSQARFLQEQEAAASACFRTSEYPLAHGHVASLKYSPVDSGVGLYTSSGIGSQSEDSSLNIIFTGSCTPLHSSRDISAGVGVRDVLRAPPSFRNSLQPTSMCSQCEGVGNTPDIPSASKSPEGTGQCGANFPLVPPEVRSELKPWNFSCRDVGSRANSGHCIYLTKRILSLLARKRLHYRHGALLLQLSSELVLKTPRLSSRQVLAFPASRRARRLGLYTQIAYCLLRVTELLPELTNPEKWWHAILNKSDLLAMKRRIPPCGPHYQFSSECIRILICLSEKKLPSVAEMTNLIAAYQVKYSRASVIQRLRKQAQEDEELRADVLSTVRSYLTSAEEENGAESGTSDCSQTGNQSMHPGSREELARRLSREVWSHSDLATQHSAESSDSRLLSEDESQGSRSKFERVRHPFDLNNVPRLPRRPKKPYEMWHVDEETFLTGNSSGGVTNAISKIERLLSKKMLSETECRSVLRSARKIVNFICPLERTGFAPERTWHMARRVGVIVEMVDVLFRVTSLFPLETQHQKWWQTMFDVVGIDTLLQNVDRFKMNKHTQYWVKCWHILRAYKSRERPSMDTILWVRKTNEKRYRKIS